MNNIVLTYYFYNLILKNWHFIGGHVARDAQHTRNKGKLCTAH